MLKFKIQAYNREMTKLVEEYDKEIESAEDALLEAYYKARNYDIVVLMQQSIMDKKCWKLIAKFY